MRSGGGPVGAPRDAVRARAVGSASPITIKNFREPARHPMAASRLFWNMVL